MKGVNWTKWSAISEVLSSVAIVATLIYLTIQTQQNAAAIQANSRQAIVETDLQILEGSMNHPEMWAARYKPELTLEEKVYLEGFLIALVRTREHQWLQYQNGVLDEQTWESYLKGLSGNLSWPRTRGWWEFAKHREFDDRFVDYIDQYLSKEPLETDTRHPFDRFEN
jgi:hypothetical protein